MSKHTGGPAFPSYENSHGVTSGMEGMTLRDYFAATCCAAMVSTINDDGDYARMRHIAVEGHDCDSLSHFIAQESYKQADAMLAERAK